MTDVEELLREAMRTQTPHLTLPPDAAGRALRARGRRRRRVGSTAVGLAAVGIAAGLFVATQSPPPDRVTHGPAVVGTGSAQDQAVAETKRLLALAPIPTSATTLARAPAALPGPAMGSPNTTALVVSTRIVRVPMSTTAAKAYIEAHKPLGLTYEEDGGNASGSGGSFIAFAYGTSDTSASWTWAQLEIGVAAIDAHTSAWRIDGLAIVMDQKPLPDTAAGPRVHVTLAQGCPGNDRGVAGVRNDVSGLNTALLPSAAPTAALVCRYDGLNGTPFGLVEHTAVGPATAQRLAEEAGASTLSHPAGDSVTNCPAGDGSAEILAFHYADGSDVDLFVRTSGCGGIANGVILGQPSLALSKDLTSLTGG